MDPVILITGASAGLGKATAEYLFEKGYKVYGTSRKVQNGEIHNGIHMLKLDLHDEHSIITALDYLHRTEGKLDVLINNAGIGIIGPLENTSISDMKKAFDTNFFGLLRVTQQAIPLLRKSEKAQIINISSIAGEMGLPHRGIYSASKSAVNMVSEALNMELKPWNINVSVFEPGDFASDINSTRIVAENVDPVLYPGFLPMNERVNKEVSSAQSPMTLVNGIHQIINADSPKRMKRMAPFLQKFSVTLKKFLPRNTFEKLLMNHYKD